MSDYVNLKRRGSSYLGLCPFHNERTPSFSVSKSKNICKCFSCGKGGSPVNFVMEIEQISYSEALRYLAKKYNIEIKEHEMTDEERERESERASLFAVNEFALSHFESNLYDTTDGKEIGLSYFYDRGLTDASIKKFHLGYAMEQSDDLLRAATGKGYNVKYLVDTGLCIRTDQGRVYDRFKGRVIFPVFSVSGKVIAFGGRTLKKDLAKYVNSPESLIYHKSNQLYGMYQAKPAIVKHDKCILVEGYMDVISMSQSGVENVVASSGTSLTEGQIRMIHRFTENVTVIYDGDAAGIKASLRGIDMLLAEGLNIKVLLLPDGDDPDSFSRKHTSSELEEYIKQNEVDFIQFKTGILLQGVENDPIARSKVIADIVRSIAVIPEQVTRNIYIKECSRRLEIDERVVSSEVNKQVKVLAEKAAEKRLKKSGNDSVDKLENEEKADIEESTREKDLEAAIRNAENQSGTIQFLRPYEKGLLRYVLRYGMLDLCDSIDDTGNPVPVKVIDYITDELKIDDLTFVNADILSTFNEALNISKGDWETDRNRNDAQLMEKRSEYIANGEAQLRETETDIATIERKEKLIVENADRIFQEGKDSFAMLYIEKTLSSHPDSNIRDLTLELVADKHVLSKVHTKYAHIETDEERLGELVPRAIFEYKDAILECRIRKLHDDLRRVASSPTADPEEIRSLMEAHVQLQRLRGEFAKYLGERIINPRK